MRTLFRAFLALVVAFGLSCVLVPLAVASAAPSDTHLAAVAVVSTITLAPLLTTAVVSVGAPFLVGLISHLHATPTVKKFLGGLVAIVVAAVTTGTMADGTAVVSLDALKLTLVSAVAAFVIEQASYTALWRRLDINRWLLPSIGLGKPDRYQKV